MSIKGYTLLKISTLSLCAIVVLSGCVRFTGSGSAQNDGGVYRSTDGGATWIQKVEVPAIGGKVARIPNVNVNIMVVDPQDRKTIYLGTDSDGLFYTYDAGEQWHHATPTFGTGKIRGIAVSHQDKCTVYAARANKVYKSIDCSRSWDEVYFDTEESVTINVVKTDWFNSNVVYAGTSRGEVLKSVDAGGTWTATTRIKDAIMDLVVDIDDSRIFFAATKKKGIYKTLNGGRDWLDLNDDLKRFKGSLEYKFFVQDNIQKDTFILASKYGLIKTTDGGLNWREMKLITPPGGANILSVAIDPQDSDTIYYGTDSTFYKTIDGGENWQSQKLPTTRQASYIVIDMVNPKVLYLGTRFVKE